MRQRLVLYETINEDLMFGLFKKKSKIEKLEAQHKKLLQEAFDLSKVNRAKSDEKMLAAEKIQKQIDQERNK